MVMFCIGAWIAPAANAQLIGGVLDGLLGGGGSDSSPSDAGGSPPGGPTETTDSTPAGGTTDPGTTSPDSGTSSGGLLGEILDGLAGTDEPSESSGSGSGSGGLIGGIVDGVVGAIDNTVGTIDKTVGTIDKTVEGTVGAVGKTVGSLPGAGETIKKVRPNGKSEPGKNNTPDRPSVGTESPVMDPWEILGRNYAVATDSRDGGNESVLSSTESVSTVAPVDNSVVSQIGRVAIEAVQQAAFPLILTMLVIAFLTVQNRIDRKDPKLALAPVDSEHDLLSFT